MAPGVQHKAMSEERPPQTFIETFQKPDPTWLQLCANESWEPAHEVKGTFVSVEIALFHPGKPAACTDVSQRTALGAKPWVVY